MRWKPHVRFGGRAGETDPPKQRTRRSGPIPPRQLDARRVPPPGAERDPRPPWPQDRPALPCPAAADHGRRTARRAGRDQAARPARRRRPRRRGAHRLARQGGRPLRSTTTPTPTSPIAFVDRLGRDLQDASCPPEVRQLGRTILRWRDQIVAWHRCPRLQRSDRSGQQPDQARQACRVRVPTRFRNYRIRVLLYAGRPNWDLLATLTPR